MHSAICLREREREGERVDGCETMRQVLPQVVSVGFPRRKTTEQVECTERERERERERVLWARVQGTTTYPLEAWT